MAQPRRKGGLFTANCSPLPPPQKKIYSQGGGGDRGGPTPLAKTMACENEKQFGNETANSKKRAAADRYLHADKAMSNYCLPSVLSVSLWFKRWPPRSGYQTKNHQKMPIIKLNQSASECSNAPTVIIASRPTTDSKKYFLPEFWGHAYI